MNYYDTFWNALVAVIAGAWPDVTSADIFQDTQIERIDWTQAMNNGQFSPPWVVVKLEIEKCDDWGIGPKQLITATIWYIDSTKDAETSGVTAMSGIAFKLMTLQQALFAAQTLGMVQDGVSFDVTSENPVNMAFLGAKIPFQAGSMTVQTVVVTG